jgi:hypothetical protein
MAKALLSPPDRAAAIRGRRAPVLLLAAVVALVVAGALLVRGIGLPGLPFGSETVDRSTPALLTSLADLEEYHAASGTFQVVVDLERDVRWVPSVVAGERTTFLATGTVDGIVDFTGLDAGAVTTSDDGRSVVFSLPAARLGPPAVDLANSRVLARDRGVLDRVGGMFSDNPTSEREVTALAQDKLARAAADSDLLRRTEENTRAMLTGLAHSLGYDDVEVRFDAGDGL